MTTQLEQLRKLLVAHNITKQFSDEVLESYILEAKLLVNIPALNEELHEDYVKKFNGDTYVVDYYPLLEIVELTVNGVSVAPERISSDGIIYFNGNKTGTLYCQYKVGLSSEEINVDLLPLVVALIENKEGANVSSITEGDVSVSYNNSNGVSATTIDSLVEAIREKYTAKVVLL